MKVYTIKDEVRKTNEKKEYTYYEYKFERDKQVSKRVRRYIEQGYQVEISYPHWTSAEIKLVNNI